MRLAVARNGVLIGVVAPLRNAGFACRVQQLNASHVRCLLGSSFYDRQEMHRASYWAAWSCDKPLLPYRMLAGLPQSNGVTCGYADWDSGLCGSAKCAYQSHTSSCGMVADVLPHPENLN
jgi:hypothetical protein